MSTDHTLCKAHADRERSRRCRALLSHRCTIVLSRPQGRFRHSPSGPGKRAVSTDGQPHARLPGCAGPSDLQGFDRHASRYQNQPARSHGSLPPSRPSPDHSRFRSHQQIGCGSVVEGTPAQICRIGGGRPPVLGESRSVEIMMSSRPARHTPGSASVNGHSSFSLCKIDLVHWCGELQHPPELVSPAGYLLLSVVSAKAANMMRLEGKW